MGKPEVAEVLGVWAASFEPGQAPADVVREAKRCLMDSLGVALAGSRTPIARLVRQLEFEGNGKGPATVIGDGEGRPPSAAAFANGVAAHVLDFDDTCYDGIVHASAVVWPAAAAACEAVEASGERFLAAFIAGAEAEYALGRALTDHTYWKGWWCTGLLGTIGAAVAAARAMDLTAREATHAIQIAACQTTGPRVLLGSMVKPYGAGRAAQAGLQAALFARAGMTGPDLAFEHERGFMQLYNDGIFHGTELERLGRRYGLLTPGVAVKLFPVCSAAQAAVEATMMIIEEEHVPAERVRQVRCEVPPLVAMSLIYDRPETVTQAQFSMPFAIGCILAYGKLAVENLTDANLWDPRLRSFMARVEMIGLESMAERPDAPEGADVTVITDDGSSFRRIIGASTGMPTRPFSDGRLEDKFRSCAAGMMSAREVEDWLLRIKTVETLPSVSRLMGRAVTG